MVLDWIPFQSGRSQSCELKIFMRKLGLGPVCSKSQLRSVFASHQLFAFTFYGHIKTAVQQTVIQQCSDWYTGHWFVGCYIWYSKEGPGGLQPLRRCTNSPVISDQCTNFIFFDVAYNCLCAVKGKSVFTLQMCCVNICKCCGKWNVSYGVLTRCHYCCAVWKDRRDECVRQPWRSSCWKCLR